MRAKRASEFRLFGKWFHILGKLFRLFGKLIRLLGKLFESWSEKMLIFPTVHPLPKSIFISSPFTFWPYSASLWPPRPLRKSINANLDPTVKKGWWCGKDNAEIANFLGTELWFLLHPLPLYVSLPLLNPSFTPWLNPLSNPNPFVLLK